MGSRLSHAKKDYPDVCILSNKRKPSKLPRAGRIWTKRFSREPGFYNMIWDKTNILQKLKQMHKSGKDLSYNAMCRAMQPLLSASAYHFGSYRKAIEKAGIDYGDVSRRPRWTKPGIIQLIKQAKRSG